MSAPPPEPVGKTPFSKAKPYVSKLVVKASKTTGPEYELEFSFPNGATRADFEAARKAGVDSIRAWLKEKEAVDLADIEALPWKSYQTKEPVDAGHTGWILWERDGGGQLAQAIREAPEQKLLVGPYEFVFSGKEKQFIGRRVVEPAAESNEKPATQEQEPKQ